MARVLSFFLLTGVFAIGTFILYLIAVGLPAPLLEGQKIHLKTIRQPTLLLFILLAGYLLAGGRRRVQAWRQRIERMASRGYAIWVLFGFYSVLFVWQQVTEYLALEINFLPFSFYDYMLYYLLQAKINYTGLLHSFYHLNNFMVLLLPLWLLFRSSIFLVALHGVVLSAAAVPLYFLAREKLGRVFALALALVFLNYRYLLNLLTMNFSVESFYPLMIFLVILLVNRSLFWYYVCVLLTLLIKEDSFIYLGSWGLYLLLFSPRKREGFITILASFLYIVFLIRYFIPWSQGADSILAGDLRNFANLGASISDQVLSLLKQPWFFVQQLFYPREKLETLFKVFSRFLFIPSVTPAGFLVLGSVSPLFLHGGENFVGLRFHYSAPMIPFVFFAFIEGCHVLLRKVGALRQKATVWWLAVALLFLHAGNFYTRHFTREDLTTLKVLSRVPEEARLLTHGHLLPYIGYRSENYYLAWNFERGNLPSYFQPDYCFLDQHVNPFPMSQDFVTAKIEEFREKQGYKTIYEDGTRFLFQRAPKEFFDA